MPKKKILSVFIDESGDFGKYEPHAPNYYVTMVFHEQSESIDEPIKLLDEHMKNFALDFQVFHAGPLIRREEVYKYELMETRKSLFYSLYGSNTPTLGSSEWYNMRYGRAYIQSA